MTNFNTFLATNTSFWAPNLTYGKPDTYDPLNKGWFRAVAFCFFMVVDSRMRGFKVALGSAQGNCCQTFVKNTFLQQADPPRSNIDFLEATLAEVSHGYRISHFGFPDLKNLETVFVFFKRPGATAQGVWLATTELGWLDRVQRRRSLA